MIRVKVGATRMAPHELHYALELAGVDVHGIEERAGQVIVIANAGDPSEIQSLAGSVDVPPLREKEAKSELRRVLGEIKILGEEPEVFSKELGELQAKRAKLSAILKPKRTARGGGPGG